jgi:hypothetical protein
MEVDASFPRKSGGRHVDGWRFETLRALGSPCTLTDLAECDECGEYRPIAIDMIVGLVHIATSYIS